MRKGKKLEKGIYREMYSSWVQHKYRFALVLSASSVTYLPSPILQQRFLTSLRANPTCVTLHPSSLPTGVASLPLPLSMASHNFSCDPLRQTFLLVFLSLLLLSISHPTNRAFSYFSRPRYSDSTSRANDIPVIWAHFGSRTLDDVQRVIHEIPRRLVFEALIDHYLLPWTNPIPGRPNIPITAQLIDSMEVPLQGSTGRVRMSGDGRVLYRVVKHWEKTYRLPRFAFLLDLLAKSVKRFPELRTLHVEFYINTADGPRSTIDSISQQFGALPLFSFRSEAHYIDIPIPDPVEHGSHVTGSGYVIDNTTEVPWSQKKKLAVFRGVASCIQKQQFQNWHLSPRVRVSTISSRHPHLLDAGITKWIKMGENTTIYDIETSANITAKRPLSLHEQLHYRYILDVDGGLGSSRKRWMLMSGSVPFFQESEVHQWYEPLLVKWVHFVPVDRWFGNLIENIQWARQHDERALQIVNNAQQFARKFLSEDAILEFFALLLQKYSHMQRDARHGAAPVLNPCLHSRAIQHGPMGCSTGWFQHIPGTKLPFGCRHKPLVQGNFVCHRPHPFSLKKQVKHGVYEPYPSVWDIETHP